MLTTGAHSHAEPRRLSKLSCQTFPQKRLKKSHTSLTVKCKHLSLIPRFLRVPPCRFSRFPFPASSTPSTSPSCLLFCHLLSFSSSERCAPPERSRGAEAGSPGMSSSSSAAGERDCCVAVGADAAALLLVGEVRGEAAACRPWPWPCSSTGLLPSLRFLPNTLRFPLLSALASAELGVRNALSRSDMDPSEREVTRCTRNASSSISAAPPDLEAESRMKLGKVSVSSTGSVVLLLGLPAGLLDDESVAPTAASMSAAEERAGSSSVNAERWCASDLDIIAAA